MKKLSTLIFFVLGIFVFSICQTSDPSIVYLGDINLSGGFQAGNFPSVWDLTKCDLKISFTYDANGLIDDLGGVAHAWAELGIRTIGFGNFNPTRMTEGAGVWLATDYDWNANTFDPDPSGADILDLDDKLILQKGGGMGEGAYNLPSPPPNPWANYAVWFDRDGVDPDQAELWGATDEITYNTSGIYEVVLILHAYNATSGEVYMTVNGEDQGFYVPNWHAEEPDLWPAGMTFTGDMTKMQIFYGISGYGATHTVSFFEIEVTEGCPGNIYIGDCDTRVEDQMYDGKLLSQYIYECADGAKNHGQFVKCVAKLTNEWKKAGIITGKEKGAIQSCAAQANIPY